MCAYRVLSRRTIILIGVHFAAAVVAIGSPTRAVAQLDPNLQSRIQTFAPPFVAQPLSAPAIEQPEVKAVARNYTDSELLKQLREGYKNLNSEQINELVGQDHSLFILKLQGNALRDQLVASAQQQLNNPRTKPRIHDYLIKLSPTLQPSPIVYGPNPQPQTVKISIPFNPTYESNVLKSNQDVTSDHSFGFGGGVQMTSAGAEGRPFDLIAYGLSSASARYALNPSKSLDLVNASFAYQYFLGANGNGANIDSAHLPPTGFSSGLITVETLLLGIQNTLAMTPTLHTETSDLFTPQAVLTKQNMNLSGTEKCYTSQDTAKKAASFCSYADIAFAVGQTFSDVVTQQNANVSIAATLGRRFDGTDFMLTFQTIATTKFYETYAGGRQDYVLQEGPMLKYTPNKCVTASLAVNFYQQYSSVSSASWKGVVIQPALTMMFDPGKSFPTQCQPALL